MGIHDPSLLSSSDYTTEHLKFSAGAQKLTMNFHYNSTQLRHEALRLIIKKKKKNLKRSWQIHADVWQNQYNIVK